ncbi:MAG: oxidoreductase [Bdellovibrionaceae bacterium]|nr:oxidoreductase [Pseudobdellovibrionaceae bacterium]
MSWIHYVFRKKTNRQKYKPVILITGCSSGIGYALAELLHDQMEYRVAITAMEKSLKTLYDRFEESERFIIRPLDVTSEISRQECIDSICEKWGSVNVLVNNAGISYRSVVEHMDEESELHQMETNYLGPINLIRLVLPSMRRIGRGKIINVSSVSGMLAMPTMSSYSASKFALEGASEALWYEMKPLGINVSIIQTGFIRSKSFENVYYSKKAEVCSISKDQAYCDYYANMTPFVAKMMSLSLTSPEKLAKLILNVVRTEKPRLRIPGTLDAYFFYYLRRLIPRRFFHEILFWCLPNAKHWAKDYSNLRK